jgi:hypothetical protein
MSAGDYLAGLRPGSVGPPVGRVVAAPWDAELAPAMRQAGIAVTEESVAEPLLHDVEITR